MKEMDTERGEAKCGGWDDFVSSTGDGKTDARSERSARGELRRRDGEARRGKRFPWCIRHEEIVNMILQLARA